MYIKLKKIIKTKIKPTWWLYLIIWLKMFTFATKSHAAKKNALFLFMLSFRVDLNKIFFSLSPLHPFLSLTRMETSSRTNKHHNLRKRNLNKWIFEWIWMYLHYRTWLLRCLVYNIMHNRPINYYFKYNFNYTMLILCVKISLLNILRMNDNVQAIL